MTEQKHRKAHEAFIKRLDALDRQYAPDPPESPEEAEWLEKRMKEITNSVSSPPLWQCNTLYVPTRNAT
jgi:hypothetical protein